MSTEENIQTVRTWVEAANRLDWDASKRARVMADLYAEDGVYKSPRGVVEGRENIYKAFTGLFDVIPDLITEIRNLFASADLVALEHTARGTTVKPWPAVAGSLPGRKLENFAAHVFEFRQGKIIRDYSYYDMAEQLRQLT